MYIGEALIPCRLEHPFAPLVAGNRLARGTVVRPDAFLSAVLGALKATVDRAGQLLYGHLHVNNVLGRQPRHRG
jgi:hypothetical protein